MQHIALAPFGGTKARGSCQHYHTKPMRLLRKSRRKINLCGDRPFSSRSGLPICQVVRLMILSALSSAPSPKTSSHVSNSVNETANRVIDMSRELHSRTQFVSGLDLSGVVQTGLVRKFHRKSRNGCSTCRVRRVKVGANARRSPGLQAVWCLQD